jgi:hypothetical protein
VDLRVLQCIDKCGAGDMSKFERIGHWKTYNLPHQASGPPTIRLSPTKHFSTLEILVSLREHICAILGDRSFLTFFHEHWLPGTLELTTSQPRPIFGSTSSQDHLGRQHAGSEPWRIVSCRTWLSSEAVWSRGTSHCTPIGKGRS